MNKKIVLILLLVLALAVYYLMERTVLPPVHPPEGQDVTVRIRPGSGVTDIARLLKEQGIIQDIDDFIFTAKLFRLSDKLKAGQYQLPTDLSNYGVLKILTEGKVAQLKIVIPEGYTSRQIASLFRRELEIDSTQFMKYVCDNDFIHELGVEDVSLEGYLYPDTYYFHWGLDAESVIRYLVRQFHNKYNDALLEKTRKLGMTVHQVLTLASIIEGEAMLDKERPLISAVYHNRLKRSMLLQADPTIQYIIPDGPRRLLNRDLAIDSPYNTYKYPGLPPGPVNNPGIRSIKGALEPADVPYLYFVAVGDGSHKFSRNLQEHNVAKRQFDAYRREVNRKQNDR
ncbi:endolytic transglycosylase MltG [candidate division KSB1 bacterium]|nr:endolytic transglycosylase MltG [candidate division KSB1 bacterium]